MVKLNNLHIYVIYFRSTPVELLHTLLLGSYKYLFGDLMTSITADQKKSISARIDAFPLSGITLKLSKNACRYIFEWQIVISIAIISLFPCVGTISHFTAKTLKLWQNVHFSSCGMNLMMTTEQCGFHYQRFEMVQFDGLYYYFYDSRYFRQHTVCLFS